MTFVFRDNKEPTGEWAKARAYVVKHELNADVVAVRRFVDREIFGANRRVRTADIAKACGISTARARKCLMGLHRLEGPPVIDGSGLLPDVLSYTDVGVEHDGGAGFYLRRGERRGVSDYRWEVDQT